MTKRSEKLRLVRLLNRLNQEQVAEAVGVSLRTYRDLEHGKRSPTIELLEKLAFLYRMDIADLLLES
jgi:transcriptional regulator with XRE-family HTH domain